MSVRVRFGVFDLDVAGMELRKNGVRIRLQEQPFRILATLVGRPGEVVTREELKDQIWASDTFVDFDQSLNKAVNRLREVLNDHPSHPRYIETVTRRGYRFVAHVTDITPILDPLLAPAAAVAETKKARRNHRGIRIGAIAGTVAITLAVLVATLFFHAPRKAASTTPILLIPDSFHPTLSRDGKLLAYVSTVGGDVPHIWVRQTGGGKAIKVTAGTARDFAPDLSPDGTQILFSSEQQGYDVYMTSTFPGEAKLVLADGYWCRFSPIGQSMLCRSRDGRLLILGVNQEKKLDLGTVNRDYQIDALPLWSPTGREIIFLGHRNGETETSDRWMVAALSGGEPRRLAIPVLDRANQVQPRVYDWTSQRGGSAFIIYSVPEQHSWSLFRIRVSGQGNVLGKPEQLSSGAGFLDHVAPLADDGKLVYSVTTFSHEIFKIPLDNEGQRKGPVAELPLTEGAIYYSPSASRDGRWMVYIEAGFGNYNKIVLRDFLTGHDRVLDEKSQFRDFASASISPDGSKVVFNRQCQPDLQDCTSYLVAAKGGEPEQICKNCQARGFSSNGSFVLMQKFRERGEARDRIVAVDLATKREREFLSDPSNSLYHPFLSWDDRWVVFKKLLGTTRAQILIAPVRNGQAAGQSEWVVVTDGQYGDDKPQFSSDGKLLYFTSDRDGYLCIWTQRLSPTTKHRVGSPTGYEHFHNSMGRDALLYSENQIMSDLTVSRDKVLINLPHRKDDIWMVEVN